MSLFVFRTKSFQMLRYFDRSGDIPNQWAGSFDFDHKITTMALSFHGFILALGFSDGAIIICDSETGGNRYSIKGHETKITSLSFHRTGHLIASGDASGNLRVSEVLTGNVVESRQFDSPIVEASFSSLSHSLLFVIDGHQRAIVIDIEAHRDIELPGTYVSGCWSPIQPTLILASTKGIYTFSSETMQQVSEVEHVLEGRREIQKIEIGRNGVLMLIIEKSGSVLLWNTEENIGLRTFQDTTGRLKWTVGCFDNKDEYAFFSSSLVASCTITGFSLRDQNLGMLVSDLKGPSEAVGQMLFHPLYSHIYCLSSDSKSGNSIRIWTPTYLNVWSKFVPGFDDVIANDLYYERESEFDEEEARPEVYRDTTADPIDIYSITPEYLFPSDEQLPNQLIYLPLAVDRLVESHSV